MVIFFLIGQRMEKLEIIDKLLNIDEKSPETSIQYGCRIFSSLIGL